MRKHGTSNPEQILRGMHNVDFKYEPLSKNINGYYIYLSEKRQIVRVDENLNEKEREYVLFHEIGHCLMKHRGQVLFDSIQTISTRKEEYEADLLATYLFKVHNNITRENIDQFIIPERAKKLMQKFL